ncbi:cytochrome d ubiquinol oxidase subunit II, partial [Psychromonas arctica]
HDKEAQPFIAYLGLFVVSFIGILISFYPYIIPPSLTIVEAAAPVSSLMFVLMGTIFLVPLILIYSGYAYWV